MSNLSLLAETRSLLRRYHLSVRKGLGQHFLVDDSVLPVITEAARLTPEDTVIEVGPGLGVLTRHLSQRAGRVIAVEIDAAMAGVLNHELGARENVTVVNEDILKSDIQGIVNGRPYKVVANLPYYITSPVLRRFLEAAQRPSLMVVMVQKEVAEVIAAAPGQRSLLSIGVQYFGNPAIVCAVPAASFYPAPEVDSAVIKIEVGAQPPLPASEEAAFFRLVRAGFAASRKQLANSLAKGLAIPKAEATNLITGAGLEPSRRAETLTVEEWLALWRNWKPPGEIPA